MTVHIYDELVKETNLSSLQAALLVHISHMIRFGQSVSKHKIVLFTEIANDDMMCIYESNDSLVTSRIPSSDMWKKLITTGEAFNNPHKMDLNIYFPLSIMAVRR